MEDFTMLEKEIESQIRKLPEHLKKQLLNYINELVKDQDKSKAPFEFRWEGELEDINDHYSSVDLQHKVSEWR